MNKHLLLATVGLIAATSVTVATFVHYRSLEKAIADNELLNAQLQTQQQANATLIQEFEGERQNLERQITDLQQQLALQQEVSANNEAEQGSNTEIDKLREQAYQQALQEYEQENPRVRNDDRFAEFFGSPEQQARRNMESRYLSLLHATGITSPRLEQLIDLLVQGQLDIGRLRKGREQGLITESEFYQQIKPYHPDQILASVLTSSELEKYHDIQEQYSADASLKKFEASLAQDAGFIEEDIRNDLVTAFLQFRQPDDVYMSPEIHRGDIENQVSATLETIANMRQHLQGRLTDEDMATANRFLQQQEDKYIQLEEAIKSIRK